jgi:hypothetical protein
MRGARSAAMLAVSPLLLTACVTPATGSDSYRDKAVTSMRAATSEVETASLVVRLLQRRDVLSAYADETITANETALGSISAAFGSVQPPSGDDTLHDDVSALLSDSEDAVTAARIAARRSDATGLARARAALRRVSSDLSDAVDELQ